MSDNISFSSNRNSIQKFKIVLVGDQNVGKSSIIARYIRNEFDPTKNVNLIAISPPLVSTLSAKTSLLLARLSDCSYGTQPVSNASKVWSPATSKMHTWHWSSLIWPVKISRSRYQFCREHPEVDWLCQRSRQEGHKNLCHRQQVWSIIRNFERDTQKCTWNRWKTGRTLPGGVSEIWLQHLGPI